MEREREETNCLVTHDEQTYNVTEFLKNHPGGYNYVQGYKGSKVRNKMVESHHSKSAMYLLREYKTGGRNEEEVDGQNDLEVNINMYGHFQ